MVWVIVAACLASAALAAVGYYALRVFSAVKALSREIARTGTRLAEAAGPVQTALQETQAVVAQGGRQSPAER